MVTNCEDPEQMEIEIAIVWDEDHATDNWIRLVEEESGVLVFDSNRDHRKGIAAEYQRTLLIDLCVPRSATYILKIYDRFGDGFLNGKIEVFRDRELLESLEGAVPRSVDVVIPALNGSEPTQVPTGLPTLVPTAVPTTPTTVQPTNQLTTPPTMPSSSKIPIDGRFDDTISPSKVPVDNPPTVASLSHPRMVPTFLFFVLLFL